MDTVTYRAKWVFPVDQPAIENGTVTVRNGRIAAVGKQTGVAQVRDLGNVVLLPGLINAHTHLEFSLQERPLGQAGMSFADWIARVVRHQREHNKSLMVETDGIQRFRRRAAQAGLAELRAAGVVALGDIATFGWPRECFPAPGINSTIFLELIGLDPDKHDFLLKTARSFVLHVHDMAGDVRPGISPHAPYSVSPQLVQSVCQLSATERFPVAMHLAESREELELLANHGGRMVEMLQGINAWHPEAIPLNSTPRDYLQWLATAHRALVIHGNYLSRGEIEFVGQHRERMSIVYCPRTHGYFGHEPYPLAEMLAANVRVALGTDSRASNPDLRLWEELKHVAQKHPGVNPEDIIRMGTLAAAEALGIDHDYGSITPGKVARLAMAPLGGNTDDPLVILQAADSAAKPVG
jgi:cytosine/adenosine deaminase-related metal-dependent hydrolase